MAIKKTTHLYEILIRFDGGGYKGSHVIDLERVTDGNTVYAENPGVARPVTLEEVGDLLGAETTRLIEQLDREIARADAAEALLDNLAVSAAGAPAFNIT
jgi:hypothetical protein